MKFLKRTLSLILALAMAITVLTVTPNEAQAGGALATQSNPATPQSVSMILNGQISLKFTFSLYNAYIKSSDGYYLDFYVGEDGDASQYHTKVNFSDMEKVASTDGNNYYTATIPIKPEMIGENIVVYCRKASETDPTKYIRKISTFATGTEHAGEKLNALNYLKLILDDSESYNDELVSTVGSMLNYCAAVQQLKGYKTDSLVNAGYEDTSAAISPSKIDGGVFTKTGLDIAWKQVSLIADSTTIMRLYFKTSLSSISATNVTHEQSLTVGTDSAKDLKYIDVPVVSQNLSDTQQISITAGGKTFTLKLNPYYVIKKVLSDSSASATVKNVADKLYKFAESSILYVESELSLSNIVINTAYSYLAKELYTQYDQHSLYSGGSSVSSVSQLRRELFASSEDATAGNNVYFDCSSYAAAVYIKAFGLDNFLKATLKSGYRSTQYISTYYYTKCYNSQALVKKWTGLTTANRDAALEEAYSYLKEGDIFVYYGSGGHALIYVGDGFINCTGNDYDSKAKTDSDDVNGSIHYIAREDYATNKWDNHMTKAGTINLVILRPLNVLTESDLTDYGLARNKLGAMALSATAYDVTQKQTMYDGQSTYNGDTLRYDVTISNDDFYDSENNADIYSSYQTQDHTLKASFILPEGTQFVKASDGGTYADGLVSWNSVDVKAGDDVTLQVTVKVTATSGTELPSTDICIEEVQKYNSAQLTLASPEIPVETKPTSTFTSNISGLIVDGKVHSTATKYQKTDGRDQIEVVNDILNAYGGSAIGTSTEGIISDIFGINSGGTNLYVKETDATKISHLVSNFAAGWNVYNKYTYAADSDFSYEARVRNITSANLKIGDVILAADRASGTVTPLTTYDYYIYVGDSQLLHIAKDGTMDVKTLGPKGVSGNLLFRSVFVVLRPGT